jgi:hypothetical protein
MIADVAHAYLDRGLSIVPLAPGAKKPLGRWRRWTSERMTHDDVDRWWGPFSPQPNLGVIAGTISGGLVVLDIEPEHVAYLRHAVQLPDTAFVKTARGGLHLYCRGDRPCGKAKIDGRIIGDVRGNGGYVVAPPSRIGDGVYEGLSQLDDVAQLAAVPDWLADFRARNAPPLVLARRMIADLEFRLPAAVLAMLGGWYAGGCCESPSELDFRIICACVRIGASPESTLGMLGRFAVGDNVLRHLRRDPSYFDRTYAQATSEIEDERTYAVPMRCVQARVYPGTATAGAKIRAHLTYRTADGPMTYTVPVVLGRAPYENQIAGEWRTLAAVYDRDVAPDASILDGREVYGVCKQGRVLHIWETP